MTTILPADAPRVSAAMPSDKQGDTHQITSPFPRAILPTRDDLLTVMRSASEARGYRKELLVPRVKSADLYILSRGRNEAGGYRTVCRYLAKLGYRALNDLTGAGYALPTEHDLTEAYGVIVDERLSEFVKSSAGSSGERPSKFEKWAYLDAANFERLTTNMARSSIEHFDPDVRQLAARRGAIGGTRSRRAPLWLADGSLEKLAALEGETVAVQARALKLSTATVERMRRHLRERSRLETKEIRPSGR